MEHIPLFAALVGAGLGLWVVLALAHTMMTALSRILDTIVVSARAAGEAAGVAAAWPFEKGADWLDRWAARAVEWRERRRIWRTEFKGRLSWDEFQKQMNGNTPVRNEVADAMGLLALKEPFTRADLNARFKRTMAAVHPDKGGSEHLARLTNDARALILKTKGWRR